MRRLQRPAGNPPTFPPIASQPSFAIRLARGPGPAKREGVQHVPLQGGTFTSHALPVAQLPQSQRQGEETKELSSAFARPTIRYQRILAGRIQHPMRRNQVLLGVFQQDTKKIGSGWGMARRRDQQVENGAYGVGSQLAGFGREAWENRQSSQRILHDEQKAV